MTCSKSMRDKAGAVAVIEEWLFNFRPASELLLLMIVVQGLSLPKHVLCGVV